MRRYAPVRTYEVGRSSESPKALMAALIILTGPKGRVFIFVWTDGKPETCVRFQIRIFVFLSALCPALHDALLAVLEAALFADCFVFAFRFALAFSFSLGRPSATLARSFCLRLPLRLPRLIRAFTTPASLGWNYLYRAQESFSRRAGRDHRIVLQRQMHHATIAWRHRVEPHCLMLPFGALADRQRHPMQLLAPARSIRFGLQRNLRRVLDSARQD